MSLPSLDTLNMHCCFACEKSKFRELMHKIHMNIHIHKNPQAQEFREASCMMLGCFDLLIILISAFLILTGPSIPRVHMVRTYFYNYM